MKNKKKFLMLIALGLLITSCSGNNNTSSDISANSSETSSIDSSISQVENSSSISSSSSSSNTSSEEEVNTLTQEMLDVFDTDYISFDGTNEISLYDIRTNKYNTSHTLNVSTAMDGTYWTATYESTVGTSTTIFYKNHEGVACEVSVNLMNEEGYTPITDDFGKVISWENSGMKNYLDQLVVSDFTYNNETGRYHYNKEDKSLVSNILSSANPYDFEVDDFSLIISDGEIIGINVVSKYDTTISAGYKAKQTYIGTINYGEDIVEVNKIGKYVYEPDYHDSLRDAISKMQGLTSYNTKVKFYTQSIHASGVSASGYYETVTPTDLYFEKLDPATNTTQVDRPVPNSGYGYHKFNDEEYNSYYSATKDEVTTYTPSRAYQGDIKEAAPSFMFAPEIMTYYHYDKDTGDKYYYSNDNMCTVATTFFKGVGNDINTYPIFAARGHTSSTESFTPYVVVNSEGYITYACFYLNLGLMHGVCEIDYYDFNSASLPEGIEITFEKRVMPSSWDELTIISSSDSTSTEDDVEVNAGDFLKNFFNDQDVLTNMPFFGGKDYLEDTYGFGMTGKYRPAGMEYYLDAITLYYDVPLDLNYSIDSSVEKVYKCLEDNGFVNVGNHIYVKGNITIEAFDSDLDLLIYVYRTSDNPLLNKK